MSNLKLWVLIIACKWDFRFLMCVLAAACCQQIHQSWIPRSVLSVICVHKVFKFLTCQKESTAFMESWSEIQNWSRMNERDLARKIHFCFFFSLPRPPWMIYFKEIGSRFGGYRSHLRLLTLRKEVIPSIDLIKSVARCPDFWSIGQKLNKADTFFPFLWLSFKFFACFCPRNGGAHSLQNPLIAKDRCWLFSLMFKHLSGKNSSVS